MIYVIGDSFAYGNNFIFDKINNKSPTRLEKIYSTHLSKKLNQKVKNLSVVGGSNWRIARIIASLNLTKDDIVIINWSQSVRLELGSSNKQVMFSYSKKGDLPIIDQSDIEQIEEHPLVLDKKQKFPFGEFIEKDKSLYLRRMLPAQFSLKTKEIVNDEFIEFTKKFYTFYASNEWFEEMFKIMFMSTVYKLQKFNTKFLMFNTFTIPYTKDCEIFNIPNYLLGYQTHMCKYLRNTDNTEYWNEQEHLQITDFLLTNLKDLYDI